MKPEVIGEDVVEPEAVETEVEPKASEGVTEPLAKSSESRDHELRLLHQEFLLEPDLSTRDWLRSKYV